MSSTAVGLAPRQRALRILDAVVSIATAFLIALSAAGVLVRAEAHCAHVPLVVDAQSSTLLAEM